MNGSLRWKLLFASLLVFIAGGVCGFLAALHMGRTMIFHHPPPGSIAAHFKDHLRHELNLTPGQVEKISPIVDRATAQLDAKREQTSREIREIFEQAHREMLPLLTPQQRTLLERMEQRHREMMHRFGPPPGPPPP
jgi:Spy/CpxP family protein refolding chaperone